VQFESECVFQRFDESPRESLPLSVRPFEAVPGDADGHAGDHEERRRDRQPFKVFRLARLVFGDEGDGGVEPGEAGDAGADKDEEGELVERGAESEGKGGESGRDAERDRVGERVEFLAEHRTLLPPARDLAVEGVKDEAGDGVRQGAPEEFLVVRDHVLCGREEGQGAAEAVAEGDDVGEAEVADEAKVAVVLDKLAQLDPILLGGGGLFNFALGGLVRDGDALSASCEGVGRLGVGSRVDGSGRFRRGLSGRAGDGGRCQICGSSCVFHALAWSAIVFAELDIRRREQKSRTDTAPRWTGLGWQEGLPGMVVAFQESVRVLCTPLLGCLREWNEVKPS
jgi:hypothetical protein